MPAQVNVRRVLAITVFLVFIAAGIAWYAGELRLPGLSRPSNSIMVIKPYRYAGTWVFDDETTGLRREPFVGGMPEIIEELVKNIPDVDKGFRLLFSTHPFPGCTLKLIWRRGDRSGNWYYCEQYQKEGWLCPSLFKYYHEAPKELYAKAEKD